MPKKASPKATSPKSNKVNKSAWIREQPTTLGAADVVKKAAAAGIKLTIAQVYTTRSQAKKAKAKGVVAPKGKGGRPKGSKNKPAAISGGSSGQAGSEVVQFKRLVLSIGLPAAESYLRELKSSVGL